MCQVTSGIYDPKWLSFVIPETESSSNFLGEKDMYDGCKMFEKIPQMDALSNSQGVQYISVLKILQWVENTLLVSIINHIEKNL